MLHYIKSGNPKGAEVLVLLHGFMEDISIWEEMEAVFSRRFLILKIDMPGHGRSGVVLSDSIEEMAVEVKKVTEHLGMNKIHLLGHSMGGYVSLAFAEKYPDRTVSLVLFFSTSLADTEDRKINRQKSLGIIRKNFSLFVNMSIPTLFAETENRDLEFQIEKAKKIASSQGVHGMVAAQSAMMKRKDRTSVLDNFSGKIIIIVGNRDTAVNTKDFLSSLPKKKNIKIYTLNCGHMGHWEKPEECVQILNAEL
ncbi:MAG: alpha/beta hydrolase [Bergeyella sp.]|nr:alpha/beta hydrolase [Bergeyella sp.]